MTQEVSSRVTQGLPTFEVLQKLIVWEDFEDLVVHFTGNIDLYPGFTAI